MLIVNDCKELYAFGTGTEFIRSKYGECQETNIKCNSSTYYIEENE